MSDVRDELGERLRLFQSQNKLVEAQRLEQRTQLDLEMMQIGLSAPASRTIPGIWMAARREIPLPPCSTIFRMTLCCSPTSPISVFRRSAACSRETVPGNDAGGFRLPAAVRFG